MQTAAQTFSEPARPAAGTEPIRDASAIPQVTRTEGAELARAEYRLLLGVIQSLEDGDWEKPTACTLWDVRRMVAHIAGALAGYASWKQFARQYNPMSYKPYKGEFTEMVDLLNAVQVGDRESLSPDELKAELQRVGPKALRTRSKIPIPLRAMKLPSGAGSWITLGYLIDTIYPRDMWMHRVDLSRATERAMRLTPEHDGRIVALVMRDLSRMLAPKLRGASVLYSLGGPARGTYRIGVDPTPKATIAMDALDFNILASGRITQEEAQARDLITVSGDPALVSLALSNTKVLY